ncbi:MAG: aspartate-semialdehyde dehydrogenase, partial [Devosia sp.]|nr:aspartate-semialdehyde dehydrogenase [Devosia sp.]
MGYRVAVVGATGNVGREVLNILAERKFPADEVFALASSRSIGKEISYGDKVLKARDLQHFDFTTVDFAIMSAGGSISKEWAQRIAAAGAIVIDNSSFWRYHSDVPLIVPEVNGDVLERWLADEKRINIIANPNCSTAQLVVALKPLHDAATITRAVVST